MVIFAPKLKHYMKQHIVYKIATAIACILVLASCSCENLGDGVVMDAETKRPIHGVTVKSFVEKSVPSYVSEMVTDSTGMFHGSTGKTKGGFSGCSDLMLEFEKSGYTSLQIYNPQSDVVYLKPIKKDTSVE